RRPRRRSFLRVSLRDDARRTDPARMTLNGSDGAPAAAGPAPILEVTDLVKEFPIRSGFFSRAIGSVKAVSGVTFSVLPGQTLGIVGESGCGKSTTGRLIMR